MRFLVRTLAVLAALALCAQQAAAQDVSILRDSETERLLKDMVNPLVLAAGMPKDSVDVVVLNDPSVNAMTAGGQVIYVNSGLINAADNANQVQGVLAHELGHIVGGHSIGIQNGVSKATKISVLSLLLGLAAAVAGAGDAAMGAMALGQQAAYGNLMAFSRAQEESADAAGSTYLSKAGISGKGSLDFFGKLQNLEFRYGYPHDDDAAFASNHPMTSDRIATLRETYEKDPAWNAKTDPKLEARFQRAKAKLYGYLAKPEDTLRHYPEYMTGEPATYARVYAYHKEAKVADAVREADALLAMEPNDPYFLEIKGQVLLESGQPNEALGPLRKATELTNNDPLIASTFGHALVATEDKSHLDEAETVLRASVARDRENPFAWYELGMVYGAKGDIPRAQLASAEQQIMSGSPAEALRSANSAEAGLAKGSSDWLRAGDIAMEARAQLERNKHHK
ncbi:MAG: M48 family metalloprotease [Porphyrobacter sp.]|nr:M48 family metalloprotease [Porphyrobacter sp.]